MKPKENPEDKAARLRERRISQIEREKSGEQTAFDLRTQLSATYGLNGLPSRGVPLAKPKK